MPKPVPEVECLNLSPHAPHNWNSLSHTWWCPGIAEEFTVWEYAQSERLDAHVKHGPNSMESSPWDDPNGRRLRILLEEVGEVAKEFNDADIENRKVDAVKLFRELIQVTAMAGAWADKILPLISWQDLHE